MKRVLVLGLGSQGSIIARYLNGHAGVSEIICADYDADLAKRLSETLSKATAVQVDARKTENISKIAQGCDFIFNGLPLEYNIQAMEAALEVNAGYLDLAGPMEEIGFIESYQWVMSEWHERFKAKGLLAIVGAGSAPGLANVLVREAVEKLDSCDFIGIYFYDGFKTNRFIPFWWSPEVALVDMAYNTFRYENGEFVIDAPFSRPKMMKFRGIDREIRMVDHEHDEPVTMGLLANSVLKGAKDIEFKYGGPQIELCQSLYQLGLLSQEPVMVKGNMVAPLDVVLKQIPRAPRFDDEIQAVIDEGIIQDEGAFLVQVKGLKDGKKLQFDSYINFPGLVEAFAKSKMSQESYLTGQCAAVFSAMMVEDLFKEAGIFCPEQLDAPCREFILKELAKLEITVDEYVTAE